MRKMMVPTLIENHANLMVIGTGITMTQISSKEIMEMKLTIGKMIIVVTITTDTGTTLEGEEGDVTGRGAGIAIVVDP